MAKYKILGLIILVGAFLRWLNLSESMSFLYDQARDALAAVNIMRGDPILVGPTTDMPGLFFGPAWYYLLAVLYTFLSGDPAKVLVVLSLLDLATIVLIYRLAARFFDHKTGLLASAMWAIGALPVAYARTLANPASSAFWTLLVVEFLLGAISTRKFLLAPALFVAALIFQFNAAGAYLLMPFVLAVIIIERKKIEAKWLLLGLFMVAVTFLPQILFEIRNSFLGVRSIARIFAMPESPGFFFRGLWLRGENLKMELTDYTFFGHKVVTLVVAGVSLLTLFWRRGVGKMVLWLWLILPIFTFLFLYPRGESHPFYLLTWVPAIIIVIASLVTWLWEKVWPVAVFLIGFWLYFNSFGLGREIFLKDHLAQPADPVKAGLNDQKRVLDYLYSAAAGKQFGYYAYNVTPYWHDENWRYLFSWYGKEKYGYEPLRHAGSPLFIIYEPEPYLGRPFLDQWLTKMHHSANGQLEDTRKIGEYTVEKLVKKES
ncbi:glycosyltransferase family 39 protein [Candidatus Gottesmanbacteria bacterium]|nr:glycosyltransferase family 39 protein [Candidatus Gottesmanbacteria bacterium]